MTKEEYAISLNKFVPDGTASILTDWIFEHAIQLTVSKDRKTKLGDFRTNMRDNTLRISVNGGLNSYSFLITLVHEIAHAIVHKKYKRRVKPHGIEWKLAYQDLMLPFFEEKLLPNDILLPLLRYMQNPKASSNADKKLFIALRKYDSNRQEIIYLEDLEEGSEFILQKRLFRKGKKRRSRFLCFDVSSGKEYTVNGLAEVLLAG